MGNLRQQFKLPVKRHMLRRAVRRHYRIRFDQPISALMPTLMLIETLPHFSNFVAITELLLTTGKSRLTRFSSLAGSTTYHPSKVTSARDQGPGDPL
jgi:hypothetical protein